MTDAVKQEITEAVYQYLLDNFETAGYAWEAAKEIAEIAASISAKSEATP